MRKLALLTVTAILSAAPVTLADSLPIERGYYVESGTNCPNASNATITLYDGTSFGNAHLECRKPTIQKLADGSYEVTDHLK